MERFQYVEGFQDVERFQDVEGFQTRGSIYLSMTGSACCAWTLTGSACHAWTFMVIKRSVVGKGETARGGTTQWKLEPGSSSKDSISHQRFHHKKAPKHSSPKTTPKTTPKVIPETTPEMTLKISSLLLVRPTTPKCVSRRPLLSTEITFSGF